MEQPLETTSQLQMDFESEAQRQPRKKNVIYPQKKKRGGYHGGHRPKTLAEGARRHSIWSTDEEFAELKGFLASYRAKAKEAVQC